ncbi:hypothetical protein NMY22_g2177 [Coprinellus aureogranulatus]|nr:hypothetical protein NMY22_g2177 [Coprinellus aureogranulatus]
MTLRRPTQLDGAGREFDSSRLEDDCFPLELLNAVMLDYAREFLKDIVHYCTQDSRSQIGTVKVVSTHDNLFVAAIEFRTSASRVKGWFDMVDEYFQLRWPSHGGRDDTWWFWTKWCPYRFLYHLELTITGLSPPSYDMETADVVALGKPLSILHLRSLTLRTRYAEQLCNGLVMWPQQLRISSLMLCFGQLSPPEDWRNPFFPHTMHAFPALVSLQLQYRRSPYSTPETTNFHPAFERRMREPRYQNQGRDIYSFYPNEAPAAALRRIGHNLAVLCPRFMQIAWQEQYRVPNHRWQTDLVVCRRIAGRWEEMVAQVRDQEGRIVQDTTWQGYLLTVDSRFSASGGTP